MSKAAEQVIDITWKKYVREGPHLWVSTLLHQQGPISSKKIWEEFLKDNAVSKDLIKSKKFLKERILHQMLTQGKINKGKAIDMPMYNRAGWVIVPNRAFKNVAPEVLSQIEPLPAISRDDYKEYLRKNNIPYDF